MDVVDLHTHPCSSSFRHGAHVAADGAIRPEAGGGRAPASAPPSGQSRWGARLVSRARKSVWLPVVTRAGAAAVTMLGLAAVGASSTLAGTGVAVELPASQADMRGVWLPSPKPQSAVRAKSESPDAARASAQKARGGDRQASAEPRHHGADGHAADARTDSTGKEKSSGGITKDGRVILNTANAKELTELPGVGPKRAEAIVRLRERLKRFRRPSDLLRVRGIGVKTLKKMLPHLVVDPPKDEQK